MGMFEHFTESAIKVIMLAQEEARLLGSNEVDTWALLLGCHSVNKELKQQPGFQGLDLKTLRQAAETVIGHKNEPRTVELPLTDETKLVFENAMIISRQLMRNYIDAEMILVATLRVGTTAKQVFDAALKIRNEAIREVDDEVHIRIGRKNGNLYLRIEQGAADPEILAFGLSELATQLAGCVKNITTTMT